MKGWTEAIQLRAGDILVTVNGDYVVVEQVQHEILETPVQVFNFEVSDFHTYFVGGAYPFSCIMYAGKERSYPRMAQNWRLHVRLTWQMISWEKATLSHHLVALFPRTTYAK